MPIYTASQLSGMTALQRPAVTEIETQFKKMHKTIAAVLKNHVPTRLKAQTDSIAAMNLFNAGTYAPCCLLHQSGYLSTRLDTE